MTSRVSHLHHRLACNTSQLANLQSCSLGPPRTRRYSSVTSFRLMCNAVQTKESSSDEENSAKATGSRSAKSRPSMRLEKVERLGEESWAGVAAVDRGYVNDTSFSRAAFLFGGDIAAILIFAAVGRGSHSELDGISGVLVTAWPFLAGWITGAAVMGAYGATAQHGTIIEAAAVAGKAWCIAIVVSLLLRSVSRGAPPPVPFAIVASVATSVLLIGWRSAFAAFMPRPQGNGRKLGSGNKSGNPFEFLKLLGSLTKRW